MVQMHTLQLAQKCGRLITKPNLSDSDVFGYTLNNSEKEITVTLATHHTLSYAIITRKPTFYSDVCIARFTVCGIIGCSVLH